jgi:signal transduction histidine kinase
MLGDTLGHWVGLLAAARVSVHLSVNGDAGSLPGSVEAAAAGVVAEGLANVAAHSAAPEVTVSLQLGIDGATVAVCDPGPARQNSRGSNSGLARQHRRITDLGGHLHAGACPNGGFALQAHLPAQIATKSR